MLMLLSRYILRPRGTDIYGHNIRVVLVGAIVYHNLEAAVLRLRALPISRINIRANLVGLLRPYLILLMEASLVTLIILDRVVVSL